MISVRRIQFGERDLFRELRLASLKESPQAFSSTYESASNRTSESWGEQADSTAHGTDRCTFFAFSNRIPVGIAAIYRDNGSRQEGEIVQVWVSPDFRRTGVARALLNAIVQWCRENGISRVTAKIRSGNERALRFYANYGFTPADGNSPGPADDVVLVHAL